jgi:hypothetical protein
LRIGCFFLHASLSLCDPVKKVKIPVLGARRAMKLLPLLLPAATALSVGGLEVTHARLSPASRALDFHQWPKAFPYSDADLTPEWAGGDQLFYTLPKFVHHAGPECREALTKFYQIALPPSGTGAVLDLCSSWTSHYPEGYKAKRCAALGLNPLELLANPSKTEWRVQNLNEQPQLPYEDASFDVVTNSLSVDYLTRPLEVFAEMGRVLRPGGLACMAYTNRCFPTKVVPVWLKPGSMNYEAHHALIVASYFKFSGGTEWEVSVADVSPQGWVGERDPMVVVIGKKLSEEPVG